MYIPMKDSSFAMITPNSNYVNQQGATGLLHWEWSAIEDWNSPYAAMCLRKTKNCVRTAVDFFTRSFSIRPRTGIYIYIYIVHTCIYIYVIYIYIYMYMYFITYRNLDLNIGLPTLTRKTPETCRTDMATSQSEIHGFVTAFLGCIVWDMFKQ